ncbi:hypothetical protein H2204_002000 [Knufia peltigerae]|uniref:DUF6536 domain-containing protein n=1 Tax=Knufia peltigerae TaxID=1002370 RepID=A0AA39D145_9EURO|nr:hypothetical protein H2204_002000 [Knufia peltigerae]
MSGSLVEERLPVRIEKASEELLANSPSWFRRIVPDHKYGMFLDIVMTATIFITHLIFFAWAEPRKPENTDFWGQYGFEVFSRVTDCDQLKHQRFGWSFVVNAIAALISIFSSHTLQALSAPNRKQLDACHSAHEYMEIGVQSFHNVRSRWMGWKRRSLWVLLMFMCLPFHLLYNSIIILSIPASESYQVTLSQAFFDKHRVTTDPFIADIANQLATSSSGSAATTVLQQTATATTFAPSATSTIPSDSRCPTSLPLPLYVEVPQGIKDNSYSTCWLRAVVPKMKPAMGCADFAGNVSQMLHIEFRTSDLKEWNSGVTVDGDDCKFLACEAYCIDDQITRRTVRRDHIKGESNSMDTTPSALKRDDDGHVSLEGVDILKSSFDNDWWKTAYSMSPYLAWTSNSSLDATDSSQWSGLNGLERDLSSLWASVGVSTTFNSTSSLDWDSVTVLSSDWQKLDLDDCIGRFGARYRPYAGSLIVVADYTPEENYVLGLTYLSYNTTGVSVVCPEAWVRETADELIQYEKPLSTPLIFGLMGHEQFNGPGAGSASGSFHPTGRLCPSSYPLIEDYQPQQTPAALGCLLRNRGSECRLGYNVFFFVVVMICLVIKLILLLVAYFVVHSCPITTVGDAMAEFLENEDSTTKGSSIEWDEKKGWKVTGPLQTYPQSDNTSSTRKPKRYGKVFDFLEKQWRLVWPEKDDCRLSSVPKWDIINYSSTMHSHERLTWFSLYLLTLGVCGAIFTYIALQKVWIVYPNDDVDLRWMIWPTIVVNAPQLFATFRGYMDNRILTERNSLQEFAGFATGFQGLRVTSPDINSAQRDPYFFGNMNFVVYAVMTLCQTLYAFIVSQLVIPQWINPLQPQDPDDYLSPAFLMRFGSDEDRNWKVNATIIALIVLFPFLAIHVINVMCSLVVHVRLLHVRDLSTYVQHYLLNIFFCFRCYRPSKRKMGSFEHKLPMVPLQMPGPGTNSLVVSVACHPLPCEQGQNISKKPLMWGVVRGPAYSGAASLTGNDTGRGLTMMSPSDKVIVSEEEFIQPRPAQGGLNNNANGNDSDLDIRPAPKPTTFTIRRKPVGSGGHHTRLSAGDVSVTETASDLNTSSLTSNPTYDNKPGLSPEGHCSFSTIDVGPLQPSQWYTGIRRDARYVRWLSRKRRNAKRSGSSGESYSSLAVEEREDAC